MTFADAFAIGAGFMSGAFVVFLVVIVLPIVVVTAFEAARRHTLPNNEEDEK